MSLAIQWGVKSKCATLFFLNGQIPASFCLFCPFLITISIIQIEKSLDCLFGIRTRGHRMVGADKPQSYGGRPWYFIWSTQFDYHDRTSTSGTTGTAQRCFWKYLRSHFPCKSLSILRTTRRPSRRCCKCGRSFRKPEAKWEWSAAWGRKTSILGHGELE